jgi:6,7-dimethyl-8-ribityllumazine synthase
LSKIIKGSPEVSDVRIGIVVSRWNDTITSQLLAGAERVLTAFGVTGDAVTIVEVPGAFEIPITLDFMAESSEYDALIALGCVVKGETAHFEYVSNAAMEGIREVMLTHSIPIACGVLTTYTMEQAEARAEANDDNKGSEAAMTALEMVGLIRTLSSS